MDAPELDITEALIRHQREAEWCLAASAFGAPELARSTCGYLSPDDLISVDLRSYWHDILTGKEATEAAVDARIMSKLLEYLSRVDTIGEIHLKAWGNVIADDIYLRTVSETSKRLAAALFERKTGDVLSHIQNMGQAIPAGEKKPHDAADAHLEFMAGLDGEIETVMTGLAPFDEAMGGYDCGSLHFLAARPSMGKTALGYQFAEYNADRSGLRTLYFSIEMKRVHLWARRALGIAEIDYRLYKNKRLTPEQKENVEAISLDLMNRYSDRLIIEDGSQVTVQSIWQMTAQAKPDFVIVDHMGLVFSDEKDEIEKLGNIAWSLKSLAKQYNVPVLALYQINRGVEGRDNKRPKMSDLRGSGKIEEHADTICFLYRDDYYQDPKPGQILSPTEIVIEKNRMGTRNVRVNTVYHLKKQMFFAPAETTAPRY